MSNLSQLVKNRYFINSSFIKFEFENPFEYYVAQINVITYHTQYFVYNWSILSYLQIPFQNLAFFTVESPKVSQTVF